MKQFLNKLFILLMAVIQFVIKWARYSFIAVFLAKMVMFVVKWIERWLKGRK